ncbi:alpha/beta hydrolase [Epibacterium ulvae]|uniref:alpha/beta fold hydrolase n=1 Tax=Epibacterium ulvae TaxID=1156985 RepID=UPI001BFC424C|nr:alpha/beta hydrolase [Epibacterium ulvae]MBT8153982.1 alpha/beta hydrolase [Epibacterium ulvae]
MPKFQTADGLSLYFTDSAETDPAAATRLPLLCLPGLTRCGLDFRYFAPHAARYRLITLDFRGRGQSEYDPNFTTYNVPQEAQDVIALLDHLAIPKAALLGTSRGGLVAMTLAVLAKERLAGVILNDVGPEIPPGGIARIMDYLGRKPAARTLAQAAKQLETAMQAAFPDVSADRWFEEVATFYTETPSGLELSYDAKLRDALLAQAEAGPIPDLWPLFHTLEGLPLAALRGENSDILARDTFDKMALALPDAICQEIPNRGHVPFLDEPDALNAIHSALEQIKWPQ